MISFLPTNNAADQKPRVACSARPPRPLPSWEHCSIVFWANATAPPTAGEPGQEKTWGKLGGLGKGGLSWPDLLAKHGAKDEPRMSQGGPRRGPRKDQSGCQEKGEPSLAADGFGHREEMKGAPPRCLIACLFFGGRGCLWRGSDSHDTFIMSLCGFPGRDQRRSTLSRYSRVGVLGADLSQWWG